MSDALKFDEPPSSQYPQLVNVSDVFKYDKQPHIDNRQYLHALAMHVAQKVSLRVMVIVGPKDSGKSEGIIKLKGLWEQVGHIVLDLDLKGKPQLFTGTDAMIILSRDLVQKLQFLDYHTYFYVHQCMASVCWKELKMPNRMMRYLNTNLHYLLVGILSTIVAIIAGDYCTNIGTIYAMRWAFRCFVLLFIVGVIILLVAVTVAITFPYFVYEYLSPIDHTLKNGDWDTLICFLNCICAVRPESRPILIIREIINFHPETLQECLRAMERAKQKEIHIPIILETSDCLWTNVMAVKRSSLSFRLYHMQEMLYEEGERDMVTAGIYTPHEYKRIYERLGGHIGSYLELWDVSRMTSSSIERSLETLQRGAFIQLQTCISSQPDGELLIRILKDLHTHNYVIKPLTMSAAMKLLIDCNVLFYNGESIQPSRRIMMHAIRELLK